MEQSKIRQQIAWRLKELRAETKQEYTASLLNLKRPTYQAYEEGRAVPPLSVLIQLKEMYGFKTIDDLITPGRLPESQDQLTAAYKMAPKRVKDAIDALLHLENLD